MIRVVIISQHLQETEILQMVFKQKGYATYTARCGAVNYLQLLQFNPDFVLLEIPERHHDQLLLLRTLRKNERFAQTPVIAYGSVTDPIALGDLKCAGCEDHMTRPLKLNRLFEIMHKVAPNLDLDSEGARIAQTRAQESKSELTRLQDSKESPSDKLTIMVNQVGKLLSFPFVIAKILDITNDPKRGADDLATLINGDQSLSTTILKVSNSVHFASSAKEIKSSKEAIMRLGFNEVKSIALGLGLMELFPSKDTFGFQRMDFWTYSLGRALIAEKLAKHGRYPDSTIAFLAGLLSDFPVLLLDAFFPQTFQNIIHRIAQNGSSFGDAFKAEMGFYAEDFLVKLMEQWRLPHNLIECFRLQPLLSECVAESKPSPQRILADAVALSAVLVRCGRIGRGLDDVLKPAPEKFIQELKLPTGISLSFFDAIYAGLNMYASFFGIDRKLLPSPPLSSSVQKPALYISLGKPTLDPFSLFLAHTWKLTPAHDAESVSKALLATSFQLVILHPIQSDSVSEAHDILSGLTNLKNDTGTPVGILGIWPNDNLPAPAPGVRFASIPQHEDLRKLDLILESVLQ